MSESQVSVPARPGKWVDASTPLSTAACIELVREGVAGVVRYVPLPSNGHGADISPPEVATILGAGLQLMLVQHVRTPPWLPTMHDGGEDGATARNFALAAGYPTGCHLFLDLEGVQGDATSTTRYCEDWATAVRAGGLRAGLYCGYSDPLTPDELYRLPGFDSYWSDAGHRRVSTRGVAMSQGAEVTIAGVKFDADVLSPDLLGDVPYALAQDEPPVA